MSVERITIGEHDKLPYPAMCECGRGEYAHTIEWEIGPAGRSFTYKRWCTKLGTIDGFIAKIEQEQK